MNDKPKLIPKLRFPQFQNEGEWEMKKLKNIIVRNNETNKENKYSIIESISNKHGFVKQEEYFDNRIVASKDTRRYYVIKKGCFAYNPSRIDVGSLAYKNDDTISIISPLYIRLVVK